MGVDACRCCVLKGECMTESSPFIFKLRIRNSYEAKQPSIMTPNSEIWEKVKRETLYLACPG
jgi:hypothetical protein